MIYKILEEQNFIEILFLKNAEWSSSLDTLEPGQSKKDFDNYPVLDRMELQLNKSNIPQNILKILI